MVQVSGVGCSAVTWAQPVHSRQGGAEEHISGRKDDQLSEAVFHRPHPQKGAFPRARQLRTALLVRALRGEWRSGDVDVAAGCLILMRLADGLSLFPITITKNYKIACRTNSSRSSALAWLHWAASATSSTSDTNKALPTSTKDRSWSRIARPPVIPTTS